MELNKTTIELLNSNLKTRYAIFIEIEDNKHEIQRVKYGINIKFHINYAINEYVQEIHTKKIAELMSTRIPITEYWQEMEDREKIINHSIITHLNTGKPIQSELEAQ